jgi:twitching motility protein PilJ
MKIWHKLALIAAVLILALLACAFEPERPIALIALGVALTAALWLFVLARGINRQVRSITSAIANVSIGDLGARAKVTSRDDLGSAASALNLMLDRILGSAAPRQEMDRIETSIRELVKQINSAALGDLTIQAQAAPGPVKSLASSLNSMIAHMRNTIARLQELASELDSSAQQVKSATETFSDGNGSQQLRSALDRMFNSASRLAESAQFAAQLADKSLGLALRGVKSIEHLIQELELTGGCARDAAQKAEALLEQSRQIDQVRQAVGGLARRASVLALNASIQAAMVGKSGQAFAAIIEDIESLALRAGEAAKALGESIKALEQGSDEAARAAQASVNEMTRSFEAAGQVSQTLDQISRAARALAEATHSTLLSAKQHAQGAQALTEVLTDTKEGRARQIASSINSLVALADNLRRSVSAFKVNGGPN